MRQNLSLFLDVLDVGQTQMWVLKEGALISPWVRLQPVVAIVGGLTAESSVDA